MAGYLPRLLFILILVLMEAPESYAIDKKLLLAGRLKAFQDRAPIPEPPERVPNDLYDFVDRTVFKQVKSFFDFPRIGRWIVGEPKQAINIDAYDEAPNSTWFTNRAFELTYEEAVRGPDTVDGPDMSRPWTVTGAKTEGVTPGFFVRDGRGDRYVLKFDPLTNPELATGAEVISTKLFYAVGYNVPENYLVFFPPDQLVIGADVMFTDSFGRERRLNPDDVLQILERVPKMADGRFRAIASKYLAGKPKGPYTDVGTEGRDPNDVFRHEHRRELRGLQVMAAFTNHNDIRRINSLDMYTDEGYLMHYLIDFGSTLGSASIARSLPSEGFEYQFDFSEIARSFFGAGAYPRRWQRVDLRSGMPSIGYWGSDGFDPGAWKPNYPMMPFQRMTDWDGFWGAKHVMTLTDDKIAGIVKQAKYSDPRAEEYMIRVLIERRDRIGRYWYRRVNPLDRFEVTPRASSQMLRFTDLAVEAGYVTMASTTHRYALHHYDGATLLPAQTVSNTNAIDLSESLIDRVESWRRQNNTVAPDDRLFYVKIWTRRGAENDWGEWVKAHLLYHGRDRGFTLAGVERED